MLQRILTAIGVLVTALGLGAGSAWWLLRHPPAGHSVQIGPWHANTDIGSANAGMYLRANVAINGLFALSQAEAIYFSAHSDDDGHPLRTACTYRIIGRPVAAKWWSVTAYGDDNFLIPNVANRFSFNMGTLKGDADGTFVINAAPAEQPGNWLPTGTGAAGFNLTFRIYNAAPEALADLPALVMPSIKKLGACT